MANHEIGISNTWFSIGLSRQSKHAKPGISELHKNGDNG